MDNDVLIQPPHIMGRSPKILKILKEIKKIARKEQPALISGEGGTYKEIIAKMIHDSSARHSGPFIIANLATIPRDIAEAELFGYEKTGTQSSRQKRHGKVREADRGTLFLDELSEMDTSLQQKILDFLGNKEFTDTGITAGSRPDVRIIGATSRNLQKVMENGQIIKGLYDVFHEIQINIPSLRERKADILPLAHYFLQQSVEKFDTGPKVLSKEAKDYLMKYDWPHNIRELEDTIKKGAILSHGRIIGKKDLLIEDVGPCSIKEFLEEKLKRYLKEMTRLENCNLYETVLSEVEKSLIAIVLQETGGNQLKAAKTLGINRNTLRTKIKEYKIRI